MPHQLAPPLASTAKTAPFQPVASCPSFSKYPRKSHSAFKPETQRPCFLRRGDTPPRGLFVAWCNIGTFVRLCFGVSCGIARARSFVCDRGRACRGHVVPWTSCPSWPWRPWVWLWPSRPGRHARRAVAVTWRRGFSSPSCGRDTPMNASVCNGLCGVCVVLVCYLTG